MLKDDIVCPFWNIIQTPRSLWYNLLMIKFEGTHSDYGVFYAAQLRANHHKFYQYVNQSTLKHQLKIYREFYPDLITEIESAAENLNLPAENLLYEDLAAPLDHWKKRINHRTHGCTIFSIRENGHIFVGRNYDWLTAARDFYNIYQIGIKGSNRYFGISDESVWTHHTGKPNRKPYYVDAINEHGLYIGLTFANLNQWNYGLQPIHAIRYVAEKCQTTRQALNAFAKFPVAVPKNFLIADAKGESAVVEHAAKTYSVVRPDSNGVLIHTNHCLAPELQPLDRVCAHDPTTTSFVRYAEADCLISRQLPGFQFTDLWRILRNSHYVYNSKTIWSLALELSAQRFNIYYDTAMGQKHLKFSFPE